VTLVTRATFELRRDGVARLAATGPPDSTGAEWAPRKLLADVVVQGAAHPEQRDAVSAVLGFAIGPIACATWLRNSRASSSLGSKPARRLTKAPMA